MTDTTVPLETEVPEDLFDLGRAFRLLAAARSRCNEIGYTAERERARIDEWVERETESDRKQIAYWEAQITAYVLRERLTGEGNSATTPWGEVSSRALPPTYKRDEETLLTWARDHGYSRTRTTTTEVVDWERLKKDAGRFGDRLVMFGKHVPGVEVIDREPDVSIKAYEP